MSTDHLLRSLEQNAQTIPSLRQQPPLFATLVTLEGTNPNSGHSLMDGLICFVREHVRDIAYVDPPTTTFGQGGHFATGIYTEKGVAAPHGANAFRSFEVLAKRMSALLWDLPESLLQRLGLDFSTRGLDWVRILFHLAWHFPEHFARGAGWRGRLFVANPGDFLAPEELLQLYGCTLTQDRFPGLIFSQFPSQLDLVTATEWAIDLLRCGLQGGVKLELTNTLRTQFRELHQTFSQVSWDFGALPGGGPFSGLEAKVLRFDSSFRTRPATEWAGIQPPGGTHQQVHFLSRKNAVKECCILRGPWVERFAELANRAGALLPEWPTEPAAALLEDAHWWRMRMDKRHELATQTVQFVTLDENEPQGEIIPGQDWAEENWCITRPSPLMQTMVTDHRGNVDRWLGFLFYVLKERQPDTVEIRTIPDGQTGSCLEWNAMLTLSGMNLFQASARAIELVGRFDAPLSTAVGGQTFIDVEAACRYARSLRESLRPARTDSTQRDENFNASIWLKLLWKELGLEANQPNPPFRGEPEVRRALTDLADLARELSAFWGTQHGVMQAVGNPLEIPRPDDKVLRDIDDVVDRLRSGLLAASVQQPDQPVRAGKTLPSEGQSPAYPTGKNNPPPAPAINQSNLSALSEDMPDSLDGLLGWLSERVQWLRLWHLGDDPKPIPTPFLEAIVRMFRRDPGVIPTVPEGRRRWANEQIWRFSEITIQQTHACLEHLGVLDSPVFASINPLTNERCLIEALEQLTSLRSFVAQRLGTPTDPPSLSNKKNGANAEGMRPGKSVANQMQTESRPRLKQPSKGAFTVYRYWIATGKKQTEMAEDPMLMKMLGRKVHQGTISNMLKAVKKWLEAGHVLPDAPKPLESKPTTMDPKHIDMGANKEHRPKHQRNRRTSDRND